MNLLNGESPSKRTSGHKSPTLDPNMTSPTRTKPSECYVISNTGIQDDSLAVSPSISTLASLPLLDTANYKKDSNGLRATNTQDVNLKRKHKRVNRHAKSCEIDYKVGAENSPDVADGLFLPSTPNLSRKKGSRRHKGSVSAKDSLNFDHATDTEDEDCIFTVVTLDGKHWDFESNNIEVGLFVSFYSETYVKRRTMELKLVAALYRCPLY